MSGDNIKGDFLMWQRAAYKKQAKGILRDSYWLSFGVCIVAGLINYAVSYIVSLPSSFLATLVGMWKGNGAENGVALLLSGAALTSTFFMLLALTVAVIFLSNPIAVGQVRFFLEARRGNRMFEFLFSSFKSKRYLNIVKGMAWQLLFSVLWSLLFLIPGIIKCYSYSMMPFILADNPEIGYRRALELSIQMTKGYKWHIFVLQLSFLGWYLLGILCCVVGILFVMPYYMASLTEAYAFLRKNAMERGYCTPTELNLTEGDYFLDYPNEEKY
jgi:Predicted integral membrane protein